jgi:hypothetical protein
MVDKNFWDSYTRPTPSNDDWNKSMTLWPAKNPQPTETTQPSSSDSQPSSSGSGDLQGGSQGDSQGGSGSQGDSQGNSGSD